jgi:hypothetical protein
LIELTALEVHISWWPAFLLFSTSSRDNATPTGPAIRTSDRLVGSTTTSNQLANHHQEMFIRGDDGFKSRSAFAVGIGQWLFLFYFYFYFYKYFFKIFFKIFIIDQPLWS